MPFYSLIGHLFLLPGLNVKNKQTQQQFVSSQSIRSFYLVMCHILSVVFCLLFCVFCISSVAVKVADFRNLVGLLHLQFMYPSKKGIAKWRIVIVMSYKRMIHFYLFIFFSDITIIFLDLGGSRCLIQRRHSAWCVFLHFKYFKQVILLLK